MLSLSRENIQQLQMQAERSYPSECCGFLAAPRESAGAGPFEVWPISNVQDQCRREDPERFSRTAREAYFMDPRELIDAEKKLREQSKVLAGIYHSHIDTGAYFSDEDHRAALVGGTPAYPGVRYLVISVEARRVRSIRLFSWRPSSGRYEDSGEELFVSDGPLPVQ